MRTRRRTVPGVIKGSDIITCVFAVAPYIVAADELEPRKAEGLVLVGDAGMGGGKDIFKAVFGFGGKTLGLGSRGVSPAGYAEGGEQRKALDSVGNRVGRRKDKQGPEGVGFQPLKNIVFAAAVTADYFADTAYLAPRVVPLVLAKLQLKHFAEGPGPQVRHVVGTADVNNAGFAYRAVAGNSPQAQLKTDGFFLAAAPHFNAHGSADIVPSGARADAVAGACLFFGHVVVVHHVAPAPVHKGSPHCLAVHVKLNGNRFFYLLKQCAVIENDFLLNLRHCAIIGVLLSGKRCAAGDQ